MPVFIPDFVDDDVENILSHGWQIFSHNIEHGFGGTGYGICDQHGRQYPFSPTDIIRACSVARMSGGTFLDRLCIGQDGKKLIPLVEGTALYDEAVENTRRKNNVTPMTDLVPGTIYVSDKNEKFLWLGEVHIRNIEIIDGKITPIDTKAFVRMTMSGGVPNSIAKITKKIKTIKTLGPGTIPDWTTIIVKGTNRSISPAIISYQPFPHPTLRRDFETSCPFHSYDGQHCYVGQWRDAHWYRIDDDFTVTKVGNLSIHRDTTGVDLYVKSGEWEQKIYGV